MLRALASVFVLLASAAATAAVHETELDSANWAEGTCEGDCDEAPLLQVQGGRRSKKVQTWLTAVDWQGKAQFILQPQPSISVLQAEGSDSGGFRDQYSRRAQPGPTQHCETVGGSSTPACTIIPPQDGEPEPSLQSRADLWQTNATMLAAATGDGAGPCCSWNEGDSCGDDVWCNAKEANCLQCSGSWLKIKQQVEKSSSKKGSWEKVNGGIDQACRGANSHDNSDSYYMVTSAKSLDECKSKCAEAECCTGVEYGPQNRCEVWAKAIETSVSVTGYTCVRVPSPPVCTLWDGVTRVSVDVSAPLQTMRGFGAAVTHSSAIVLQKLKAQDAALYAQVMQRLFGLGDDSAGISLVRFPLGSSDYAKAEATFDDLKQPSCSTRGECAASCSLPGGACSKISGTPYAGQAGNCRSCGSPDCGRCSECKSCCCVAADHDLRKFRLDDDTEKIVATLQDAKAINPGLLLMGSPWTPPRWLKERGTLEGKSTENTIIDSDDAYSTYAKYLLKVTEVFADRGLPLAYLTLQNEPLFAPSYPGMYLSAKNYARLGKKVKALFGSSPKILIYDHNWDHPEYPEEGIKAAPGVFSGTAYHCYAGNMADAQERTHRKYPDLDIIMSECTGSYSGNKCDMQKGMDGFGWNHQWDMDNLFLGNAVHWGSGGIKWVMALDETCGPVLPTMSFLWGRPLVSIPRHASSISDIKFNQDFWTVAHMGRFVRPGAERAQATTTAGGSNSIIGAFRDESAGTVTLMAVNKDHSNPLRLEISYENLKITRTVPAWGTAVLVWPK